MRFIFCAFFALIHVLNVEAKVFHTNLNYTIKLPGSPSPIEQLAAKELGNFLDKLYSRNVTVNGNTGDVVFFIGNSPEAESAGFKKDSLSEALNDDRFGVFRDKNNFLFTGFDDNIAPLLFAGRAGTLSAVYYFLTKYLGLNFYFPGSNGIAFTPNPVINFPTPADLPIPSFPLRAFTPVQGDFNSGEMMLYFRRSLCSTPKWFDYRRYTFDNWEKRFTGKNTDMLFRNRDGNEIFSTSYDPAWYNPCFSSTGAVRQAAQDIIDLFATNKDLLTVALFLDAPYTPCQCERCRHSGKDRNLVKSSFSADDYSEEYFDFVARVGNEVFKACPDRYLLTHTKFNYQFLPQTFALDKRILINVLNYRYYPAEFARSLNSLKDWSKSGNIIIERTYVNHPIFKDYPVLNALYTAEFIRGMDGFCYGMNESDYSRKVPYNGYSALNNYIQAKMLFNVRQDPKQLITNFINANFQGAEKEMGMFYETMENIWRGYESGSDPLMTCYYTTNLDLPRDCLERAGNNIRGNKYLYDRIAPAFKKFYDYAKTNSTLFLCQGDEPKNITPPFIKKNIVINGEIAEGEWGSAAAYNFPLYALIKVGTTNEYQKTRMQIARDEDFLYIALTAYEIEISSLVQKCTNSAQGSLFSDDSIEIMLVPGGQAYPYYQIVVNSLGIYQVLKWSGPKDYVVTRDIELQSAAKIFPDRYAVELKLPLAQFGQNLFAKPWKIGVFRNRICATKNAGQPRRPAQLTGLSYRTGSFHAIDKYSTLFWKE